MYILFSKTSLTSSMACSLILLIKTDFTILFTDGSMTLFHPALFFIFRNSISLFQIIFLSQHTIECYAILEILRISSLTPIKFLIATNSLSYLQAFISNVFKSLSCPLINKIRFLQTCRIKS